MGEGQSIKGKLINLIAAVRTLMRSESLVWAVRAGDARSPLGRLSF